MKKLLLFLFLVIVPAIIINSCDDGSGGGSGGVHDSPAGTFMKQVVLAGTDSAYSNMLGSVFTDARFMLLYPASEIKASGKITSISFRYNADQAASRCSNMTIKMGHTDVTNLDEDIATAVATYASNIEVGKGSFVTVLENTDVTIPAGNAGEYFTINLSTPFSYNGIDNLVVQISRTAAFDTTVPVRTHPVAAADTYYTIWGASNSPDPSAVEAVTGNRFAALPDMQFVFRGGENIVTTVNATDNGMSLAPGYTGRTQMLIFASDIKGNGLVTGLAIYPNTTTHATEVTAVTGMTVRIAHLHSTTTALTTDFNGNYAGNTPVIVTQDLSYTIPPVQPSPVWIAFTNGNFTYDGTSNVLIDISCTVSSGSYSVDYENVPDYRVAFSSSPGAEIADEIRLRAFQPILRFHGAPISVISDGASSSNYVFNTSLHGLMGLYRPTELGTSGAITSVACRLYGTPSSAADYSHFKVIMGHSTSSVLSIAAADNFVEQHIAFNGIVSVPAGLMPGDWIEIPLASPFEYDGKSNLVVWMGTYAASGAGVKHSCSMSAVSGLYTDKLASGVPGNVTVAAPTDQKLDMQIKISK